MTYRTRISRAAKRAHRPGIGLFLLLVLGLLQAAYAQSDSGGIYTTKENEVTATQTETVGNTTTTTTATSRETIRNREEVEAQRRLEAWKNDPNAAQFPYDSTGGANRNDLDTARQGFDDPRNPWDGRYMNDNPTNHPVGSGYDRGEPVTNYTPGKYRPGAFGTQGAGNRRVRD